MPALKDMLLQGENLVTPVIVNLNVRNSVKRLHAAQRG